MRKQNHVFAPAPSDGHCPYPRASPRGDVTNAPSLQINARKRQNHAFAFFSSQRELHAERVKPPRVYQPRAPKGAAARENRTQSVAKHTRTSGCLSNHGVPQAAACRGTRELILSKKEKSHFSLFSLISLTKPKQRGSDRKRISHHICGVKALGDMSVYYLRALPCIAAIYPLAIASHPERAHFAMDRGDRRSSNTQVLQ